jgi:hypothetical protein
MTEEGLNTSSATPPADVNINFTLYDAEGGCITQQFVSTGQLGYNANLSVPDSKDSNINTSFEYSGRHDHGLLPELKSKPKYNAIVASILEAKKLSDTYLTEVMTKKSGSDGNPEKKPRTDGVNGDSVMDDEC